MICGANSTTDSALASASSHGSVLRAFNEPDLSGEANMTVEQALDLWPRSPFDNGRTAQPPLVREPS
jgi:Glycosyl hydrolase catalytic core